MRQAVAATAKPAPARQSPALPRTCVCGSHTGGGACARCREQRTPLRAALVPPGGRRLPTDVRRRMEERFGDNFDAVRVHRGGEADRAARQLHARAYTVGSDIVLGDRADTHDDGAIAHELAHVVQQRHAVVVSMPGIGATHTPLEHEARAAAANVAAGRDAGPLTAAPAQLIQREEETVDPDQDAGVPLGALEHQRVDQVMSHLLGPAGWQLLREVVRGFVGATVEAGESGRLSGIGQHLLEMQLSPWQMTKFGAGYMWGAVQGLLSPIIDLVRLIKTGVTLSYNATMFIVDKAIDLYLYPDEFKARALAVAERVQRVSARVWEGIEEFLANPREGLKQFAAMMDALAAAALAQARGIGRSAAEGLMEIGELPPFALGEKIGYVVGAVAIQILLLVFTEGIGNALSAAARAAAQGTQFVVTKAAGLLRAAMGLVRTMLNAVKALGGSVMKLFKGVAEDLAELFGYLMKLFDDALGGLKSTALATEGAPSAMMMTGTKGDLVVTPGMRANPVTVADLRPARPDLTPIPENVKIKKIPAEKTPTEPITVKDPPPPEGYEDIYDRVDVADTDTPGGAPEPRGAAVGKYFDEKFDELDKLLGDRLDEIFPPGEMKKGLQKQYEIDVPEYKDKPRADRIDFDEGEIIEIKPQNTARDNWKKKGEAQAQQYAAWLDKINPLGPNKRWKWRCVQYDLQKLNELLEEMGYFEKLPPIKKTPKKKGKGRKKK